MADAAQADIVFGKLGPCEMLVLSLKRSRSVLKHLSSSAGQNTTLIPNSETRTKHCNDLLAVCLKPVYIKGRRQKRYSVIPLRWTQSSH